MHGSVLTPRCPFDLPVMPSLTWRKEKNTNSEFCLPTCMGPASHQSQLNWFKLFNSKVCLPPALLFLHVKWFIFRIGLSLFFSLCFCSPQVYLLLLVKLLQQEKQTPLSSSSGLLQRTPTTWLGITLTSVWLGLKTGHQLIINPTRKPSRFIFKHKQTVDLKRISFIK